MWYLCAMTEMPNFYNFTLDELGDYMVSKGTQKFRAQQLYRWVYGEGHKNFENMLNISKTLRAEMPAWLNIQLPKILTEHVSKDGTRKYLFDMGQGKSVEAVLIPSNDRLTLCVSSEVGSDPRRC